MNFISKVDEGALNEVWLMRAPVAQRIRASDYGSEGREFESLQARYLTASKAVFLFVAIKANFLHQ